ncbi:MAG TPA: molybdate ABC transporter substrate-binding protein [Vicinamibacterales bacterium]
MLRSFACAGVAAASFFAAPAAASGQSLKIAAASDLQFAMPALAARFEKNTGHVIAVTFGSSGNFFTQIRNGAPFDVFLSADVNYPRQLETAGLVDRGTVSIYAVGRIVLWARTDRALDVDRGLAVLGDPAVSRVAIANPAHAPYGRAAVAAMEHAGVYQAVRGKLVFGENVSQAAQFAQTGNADATIVALSLALAPAMKEQGRYYDIPSAFYPAIEQGAAVVGKSSQKALAARFVDFLKQPEAAAILESYGFGVPHPAPR